MFTYVFTDIKQQFAITKAFVLTTDLGFCPSEINYARLRGWNGDHHFHHSIKK